MASVCSGLLEFLREHAEVSGTTLRVYEVYHSLDKVAKISLNSSHSSGNGYVSEQGTEENIRS